MMPSTVEIARQISVLAELHPEKSTSQLASSLAYPPLFIINAIAEAKEIGYIKEDKEADKIISVEKVNCENIKIFGETNMRIRMEILDLLERINGNSEDVSLDQLKFWMLGIPESALEIALHSLIETNNVATYSLADPKDKSSVYSFLTLKGNEEKQWGTKQFKSSKKGK